MDSFPDHSSLLQYIPEDLKGMIVSLLQMHKTPLDQVCFTARMENHITCPESEVQLLVRDSFLCDLAYVFPRMLNILISWTLEQSTCLLPRSSIQGVQPKQIDGVLSQHVKRNISHCSLLLWSFSTISKTVVRDIWHFHNTVLSDSVTQQCYTLIT